MVPAIQLSEPLVQIGSIHLSSIQESGMRLMATLAIVLSLNAAPALAEDCPAKSTELDDIVAALNAATGCDAAMKVFKACEYGTSGDVELGAVVEKKCEDVFLNRLTAPQKRAYQREMQSCDRKYRNQSGTMYLSFTAFCRAEVARRYAHTIKAS
jgi:hypothetical protein